MSFGNLAVFISAVWKRISGILFPVFDFEYNNNSRRGDDFPDATKRERRIRATLFKNASFYLEMSFRRSLFRAMNDWNRNRISYTNAKERIDRAITSRNQFVAKIVPSYGISQSLILLGFYSSSQLVCQLGGSRWVFRPKSLLNRISILSEVSPAKPLRIIKDERLNSVGNSERFSKDSIDSLKGVSKESWRQSQRILLVGPAPLDEEIDFRNFDEAVVLLNGQRSLPVLNLCLSNLPTHALVRSRHLVPILRNLNSRSDWRETLLLWQTLQIRRKDRHWLSETGLSGVSFPSENLEKLWGKLGKPNGIQHSVGLALELCGPNGSVTISATTFYL